MDVKLVSYHTGEEYGLSMFNLLKPTGYVMRQQV